MTANFVSIGYSTVNGKTDVDGLDITDSGNATWEVVDGTSITGSVAGSNVPYKTKNGTLTLTNKLSVSAFLSFDYSITSNTGSIVIDGTTVITDSTFGEKELAAGSSVDITITSGKGSSKKTSISITNIKLENKNAVTITFLAPKNGSYTVDGNAITTETIKRSSGTTTYALSAIPSSGYKFYKWEKIIGGVTTHLSTESTYTFTASESCSIGVVFVSESAAQFKNNNKYFYDLQDAIDSANSSSDKKIVVTGDGSVFAGTYTIASDCTLLVPFNEAEKMYTTLKKDDFATSTSPLKLYRKLILESNVTLNVIGVLAVESQLCAGTGSNSGTYCGAPTGNYGRLHLNEGSSVNLFDHSTLYAWGYITGDGVVNAKSGSTVYESFQIKNFRGGTTTSSMISDKKVFPFNQYYVQNVECKMILETGSKEICSSAIYMTVPIIGTKIISVATVKFIGDASTGSLFIMNSGTLTKQLDTQTKRLSVIIQGNAQISNIEVTIDITVRSVDYALPIASNMDIILANNSVVSTKQDLEFLPNSTFTIESESEFKIINGKKVYVYDSDQWKDEYHNSKIYYPYCATTNTSGLSSSADSDAVFDVNGTLIVEDGGYFYTTESGACIKSSKKTGVVNLNGSAATDSETFQYLQSSSTYAPIPVTSAKLQNGDKSYYETTGKSNCSIIYSSVSDSWKDSSITTDTITLKFIDQNGNELMTSSFENPGSFTFPTKDSFGSFNVYFWQFSDGTLYSPGVTSPLSLSPDSNGNYIFTARSSGWVTETSTNNSYYLSDDFGNDSTIYPGCVKGLYSVVHKDLKQQKICYFNENGLFQETFGGIFYYSAETYSRGDNCYYYLRNGVVVENAGLKRIDDSGTIKYYYFGNDNRAYTNGTYYISINLNGYLCPGTYEFNSDGSIVAAVNVNTKSAITLSGDGTYCHIDGVKVGYGLFSYNGHYYYAQSDGTLVKDKTVYVSKNYSSISITGFTFPGLYYFDSNGYLCDSSLTPVEVS